MTEKEREYQIKVTGEEQANSLLSGLIQNHITVVTVSYTHLDVYKRQV